MHSMEVEKEKEKEEKSYAEEQTASRSLLPF
jgi:hypothetical protein